MNIPEAGANTQTHRVDISYNAEYITPLGPLLDLIVGDSDDSDIGVAAAIRHPARRALAGVRPKWRLKARPKEASDR